MASDSESRVPGWMWLLTGVLLGALISLLMRLSEIQPGSSASKASATASSTQEPALKFNFYKLLRDSEATLPERSAPKTTPEDKNSEFLLQVASFRTLEDAEQARAELTLLNLDARIEKADVGQGQTWHRVLVGPFSSRSQLSKARGTLLSNRFEALVLKRDKS